MSIDRIIELVDVEIAKNQALMDVSDETERLFVEHAMEEAASEVRDERD
jgi:hypothetical protein